MDPYSKLFKERIVFLGVQIDDVSANDVMAQLLTWSRGPRPRHQHLHQLARRLVHRADRDLRHDAVRPARHLDGLPRPGRRPPRPCCSRRVRGQASPVCRTRGSSSTSRPPGGRVRLATSRSRRTRSCGCVRCWRDARQATGADRRAGPQGHQPRQDPDRRGGDDYGLIDEIWRAQEAALRAAVSPVTAARAMLGVSARLGTPESSLRRSAVTSRQPSRAVCTLLRPAPSQGEPAPHEKGDTGGPHRRRR